MDNKKIPKWIIVVIAVVILWLIGVAGGRESQYDRDFKSGISKYNSGEKMTEGEYNAVKNYNNWKSNNSEKTYGDWDH